ncbi:MAG TPA: GDYXXLXY domain-containing protein [Pyrinomonadaceae bacterium]|nr:GDYXXLXY domain-containing protein [Pyrinomonadaceae bacterium]
MSKRASLVAFIAAVVIQVLILVAVPARKVFTMATGKTVVLKVQPVDPYSILSGYYATLGFDISPVDAFPNTKGTSHEFSDSDWCYAVVEKGANGLWKPVSLELELPANLPENRAALLGRIKNGRIRYGIEEFYFPEAQRYLIGEDLSKNVDKARVEVKVDRSGHSALQRLIIEDRIYE